MEPLKHAVETLYLPAALWQAMLADVQARLPEEACGLVSGRADTGQAVIPIVNILHSPVRYRMDPQAQIDAFLTMEAQGQDLVAIYHSHPAGPAVPSQTDITEAYYPDSLYLIWSPAEAGWVCRGFRIRGGVVNEINIQRL